MTLKAFKSACIFLITAFGYIQMTNTGETCGYFRQGDTELYMKWCPDICCPYATEKRRENTTCCISSAIYSVITPPFTFLGYSWWTLFVCAICTCISISIFIHYVKRLHIFKNSQFFNSSIEPSAAFTISKSTLNLRLSETPAQVELSPPSYTHSVCPSPPPYTSVKTIE